MKVLNLLIDDLHCKVEEAAEHNQVYAWVKYLIGRILHFFFNLLSDSSDLDFSIFYVNIYKCFPQTFA